MNSENQKKLEEMIHKKQVVGIICNQWGDTGKGKIVDLMGEYFDVEARGTGGANAGHTAIVNGVKRVSHLLPMGTANDKDGKISIMGKGMVIDVADLNEEIEKFHSSGGTTNNLWISSQANVIMPYHLQKDKAENTSQKDGGIGSTGKGIGPCYADATARNSIIIADLFDKDVLAKKISKVIKYYPENKMSINDIAELLFSEGQKIKQYVRNTDKELQNILKIGKKKILLEGAQGLLLSIDYGIYPHVTSSDCSIYGTAKGAGLSPSQVDLTLGIVKFPLMTRVGGGPFPTEFKEKNYGRTLKEDLDFFDVPYKNENGSIKYDHNHERIQKMKKSSNETIKTIGIRLSGEEYGATTGRPRRLGWTDLVLLRKAIQVNGPNLILTKLDMAKDLEEFNLATSYATSTDVISRTLLSTKEFYGDSKELETYKPEYKRFNGFKNNISSVQNTLDLPTGLRNAINFMENYVGANVKMISVGPDRNQTFMK